MYSDFELQGVIDDKLNSKIYQNVAARMHTEEATCSLLLTQQDARYDTEIKKSFEIHLPTPC